jgi:hypothetical protein
MTYFNTEVHLQMGFSVTFSLILQPRLQFEGNHSMTIIHSLRNILLETKWTIKIKEINQILNNWTKSSPHHSQSKLESSNSEIMTRQLADPAQ